MQEGHWGSGSQQRFSPAAEHICGCTAGGGSRVTGACLCWGSFTLCGSRLSNSKVMASSHRPQEQKPSCREGKSREGNPETRWGTPSPGSKQRGQRQRDPRLEGTQGTRGRVPQQRGQPRHLLLLPRTTAGRDRAAPGTLRTHHRGPGTLLLSSPSPGARPVPPQGAGSIPPERAPPVPPPGCPGTEPRL